MTSGILPFSRCAHFCKAPHSTALSSYGPISKYIRAKRRSAEAPLHCPTFPQVPPRGHHLEGAGRVEPVPSRQDAKLHSRKGEDCGSSRFPVSKLALLGTSCRGGPLPPHGASPRACSMPRRACSPSPGPALTFIPAATSLPGEQQKAPAANDTLPYPGRTGKRANQHFRPLPFPYMVPL